MTLKSVSGLKLMLKTSVVSSMTLVSRILGLVRDVVFARYGSGGQWTMEREAVFPPDLSAFPRAAGPLPLHNLAPGLLLEKLVSEFVLSQLVRAALESFASENGARLRVMESAHDNVEHKLGDLRQQERRTRQEETTTELLDVVTGSEAIRGQA